MKFAPFCLFQGPPDCTDKAILTGNIEALVAAEDQGYDAAYLAEHFFSPYSLGSSLPSLATAVAMQTKRIRIGSAVSVIPFHHPLFLATDWATVDNLSDGRLEIGVGRGYNWFEFDTLGMDLSENTARFEEGLDVLRAAWTQDLVTHSGKFYEFSEAQVLPKPQQKPHPPMWYACSSPNSVQWAGSLGLGAGHGVANAEELRRRMLVWEESAKASGYSDEWVAETRSTSPIQKIVWVAETDAQAERECEELLKSHARALEKWAYPGSAYPGRTIPAEALAFRQQQGRAPGDRQDLQAMKRNQGVLAGSPETVVGQLKEIVAEYPIEYLLMYSTLGGPHPDDIKRCWRLFADKVMPHFK